MTKAKISFGFYTIFSILFVAISLLVALLQVWHVPYVNPYIWTIQAFYFTVCLLSHFISEKGLKNKPDFHIFYMASMGIRFLLSLIFLFAAAYLLKGGTITFVVNFFILYLLYTSFEIYFLLRNLRPDFKTDGTVNTKN